MGLKEHIIPFLGCIIFFLVKKRDFVFLEIKDYFLMFALIILVYLVLFYIVQKLKNEKTVKKTADKVFFVLVLGLLIIPVAKFNLADRTLEENRMLKVFPKFEGFSKGNGNYFKDLEAWFNDRFNQRARLIKYSYRLDNRINGKVFSEKAFIGKDYWLFTKERNSIGNFQKTTYFRERELNRLKANLVNRKNWLAKQNIKYYLMIAPDKNVIYGEHYPDDIKLIGKESQIDQLFNYVKNKTTIPIIYPWQELKSKKEKGLLYYKMDTHWTNYGAFFGYRELMKLLRNDYPSLSILEEKDLEINRKKIEFGDMIRMFNLKKGEYPETEYKIVNTANFPVKIKDNFENNSKIVEYSSGVNDLKVIFFCDSFTGSMRRYLSQSFGTIYFIADHHKFNNYQKFIVEHKPDLVVHEAVGKYVNDWLKDTPKLEEVETYGL